MDVIKYLLYKNADINKKGERGTTALEKAIVRRDIKLINYLLDNNADIN